MYRNIARIQLLYGHFREFNELADQLNALSRDRGWQETSIWAPTFGSFNEVILTSDYPDLAAYQRESEAFYADADAMKTLRAMMTEHAMQGSRRDEMWETAGPMA